MWIVASVQSIEIAGSRNNCSQMFFKKSVPKTFSNFTGKNLCWSLFSIKLQDFRSSHLFSQNISGGCFCACRFANTFLEQFFLSNYNQGQNIWNNCFVKIFLKLRHSCKFLAVSLNKPFQSFLNFASGLHLY